MSPISIIFAGTHVFATDALKAIARDPAFAVALVITQPDRPKGRKLIVTPSPVKVLAEEIGLPIWQPEDINVEWQSRPIGETFRPSFLVTVAYGQIMSEPILSFPQKESLNLHASLLPRWRGASPIQHAVLHGDAETGVTIFRMVKELDAGPIFAQKRIPLSGHETSEALFADLAKLGANLLVETLTNLPQPREQEEKDATYCARLKKTDGIVDPTKHGAMEIDRRVRALTPWPGVTLSWQGTTMKLLETSLQPSASGAPLPCRDDTILSIEKLTVPGGKPMSGKEWSLTRAAASR